MGWNHQPASCLGYIGDYTTQLYQDIGLYIVDYYKDPY